MEKNSDVLNRYKRMLRKRTLKKVLVLTAFYLMVFAVYIILFLMCAQAVLR